MVTPRYIKGFGVIISVNRIDVYTAMANLEQYQSKGADSVISFITDDWKAFGIPRYLQVDNEASFRGSLYHSRTFGKLTRFCLNFGVELVFIPFNEPWRNAHIESFNSRFDKLLWQPEVFKDLDQIRSESKKFRDKHNNYQKYRKNTFSKQNTKSYKTRYLPDDFKFDLSRHLPITRGRLHFVRSVNEKGNVNVLNEDFYVDKNLSFEYVWIVLNTQDQTLKIWYQATKDAPKELFKAVVEIAQKVQANLVIDNTKIPELWLFPRDNFVPGSIKLYLTGAFGFEKLTDTFTAEYKFGDESVTAFLSKRASPDEAMMILRDYYEFLLDNGGKDIPTTNPQAKVVYFYDTLEYIAVTGSFVFGVHEAENRQIAAKVEDMILNKLGEVVEK